MYYVYHNISYNSISYHIISYIVIHMYEMYRYIHKRETTASSNMLQCSSETCSAKLSGISCKACVGLSCCTVSEDMLGLGATCLFQGPCSGR